MLLRRGLASVDGYSRMLLAAFKRVLTSAWSLWINESYFWLIKHTKFEARQSMPSWCWWRYLFRMLLSPAVAVLIRCIRLVSCGCEVVEAVDLRECCVECTERVRVSA